MIDDGTSKLVPVPRELWERIQRAYDAIVLARGESAPDALSAVTQSYAKDAGDEFVLPTVIAGGEPLADGDVALFFNFRADRARELTCALASVCEERFAGRLVRARVPKLARVVCMSEYDAAFGLPLAFTSEQPFRPTSRCIANC